MASSKKSSRINFALFLSAALLASSQTRGSCTVNDSSTVTAKATLTACSPDGAFYVAATPDGRIKYSRTEDGKLTRIFYQCSPRTVAFSPDGRLLACAGGCLEDPTVQVWDLTDSRVLISIETSLGAAPCLCFSSDGSMLAFTVSESHIAVWHITKKEKLWSTDLGIGVAALHFHQQDGALVMQASDGATRKLRLTDGSVVTTRAERNR
jgi:WD40 repeat protein